MVWPPQPDSPQVLTHHWQTKSAHYGNLLISLSWSKQPKDTTTPTSNCPSTLSGGHLWTGRWFCWANLFTGTSPDKVTTSRVSTIPSLELLQIERGDQLSCTHFPHSKKMTPIYKSNFISCKMKMQNKFRCQQFSSRLWNDGVLTQPLFKPLG